uniref:RNase H type-1 domain-containing protein n=1 Tax=Cannabis sativa TaxID=3483 RepID=A0A803PB46_CANSA
MGPMLCWAIWQDRNNKVWNGKTNGEGDEPWDAATFADQNKFGYGWVRCDSGGHVLQARTGSWDGCVNLALAEALGVKEVLSWIKESKLSHVTMESDSLITV